MNGGIVLPGIYYFSNSICNIHVCQSADIIWKLIHVRNDSVHPKLSACAQYYKNHRPQESEFVYLFQCPLSGQEVVYGIPRNHKHGWKGHAPPDDVSKRGISVQSHTAVIGQRSIMKKAWYHNNLQKYRIFVRNFKLMGTD